MAASVQGQATRFSFKTIERWFYAARGQPDPIVVLARKVPSHAGTHRAVSIALGEAIERLYREHSRWTFPPWKGGRSETVCPSRAIVIAMSNAPVAKLNIDPLEAAFDEAPWDDRPATEEEVEGMRLARASETDATAHFVDGREITASIAERSSNGR